MTHTPPDPFVLFNNTAHAFHVAFGREASRYIANEGYKRLLEEWLEARFTSFVAYPGLKTYFSDSIVRDYHIKYLSNVQAVMYGAKVYFSDIIFNPLLRESPIILAQYPWSLMDTGG